MHFRAGLFRRNPVVALAGVLARFFPGWWQRELSIQRHRRLQRDERFLRANPAGERLIESPRLFFASASKDFNACRTQALEAAAGIEEIRIVHGRDDALNARSNDRLRAG